MDVGFGTVVANVLLFLSTQAEKILILCVAALAIEWILRRDQEGILRSIAIQAGCMLLAYLVLKNADTIVAALLA